MNAWIVIVALSVCIIAGIVCYKKQKYLATLIFAALVVLCCIAYVFVSIGKTNHQNKIDTLEVQEGCPCGGDFEFVNAVGHRLTTSYVYMCQNCGKLNEINDYVNLKEKR